MAFGSFQRDFLFSVFFALVGACVSVYLYRTFELLEKPKTPLGDLQIGHEEYLFTTHGKCFGSFTTDLLKEDNYELHGVGWIKVKTPEGEKFVRIETDSGFNSLGQLAGFYLFFFIEKDLISLGLQEVNPMKMTLKVRYGENDFQIQRDLPGPILLKENGDGTANISHWLLRKFEGGITAQRQPFLEALDVHVHRDREACVKDEAVALDVSPLLAGAGMVQKSIQEILLKK